MIIQKGVIRTNFIVCPVNYKIQHFLLFHKKFLLITMTLNFSVNCNLNYIVKLPTNLLHFFQTQKKHLYIAKMNGLVIKYSCRSIVKRSWLDTSWMIYLILRVRKSQQMRKILIRQKRQSTRFLQYLIAVTVLLCFCLCTLLLFRPKYQECLYKLKTMM